MSAKSSSLSPSSSTARTDVVVLDVVLVVPAFVVVVVVLGTDAVVVIGSVVVVVVVFFGTVVVVVVVVVEVVVVAGALDVTIVREPVTMLPEMPPVYVTTYSVLAVKPDTLAKNSVGQTGLLLLLNIRPFEVPLPEPTVTPSFETVHEAVTINGVVLPMLSRHPLICI